MIKSLCFFLLLLLIIQCNNISKNETSRVSADTTLIDYDTSSIQQSTTEENIDNSLIKIIDESGVFNDSFALAHFEFISKNILDIEQTNTDKTYSVALIERGYGDYQGPLDIVFEDVKAYLIAFQINHTDTTLIDYKEVASYKNFGLETGNTTGMEMDIKENQNSISTSESIEGILMIFTQSYKGAGDYGYQKEISEIYVIEAGEIKSVLKENTLNEEFTSDENGNSATINIKTEIQILNSKSNGFNDLMLQTTSETQTTNESATDPGSDSKTTTIYFIWKEGRYQEKYNE